jgi:hypothetical protein
MKFNPLYSWHQIQAFFTFEWENSLFLYGLIWPFIVYFIKYLRQRGNQPRLELSLSVPLQHPYSFCSLAAAGHWTARILFSSTAQSLNCWILR